MKQNPLMVVMIASVIVLSAISMLVWPRRDYAIIYAIPVLIASLRLSPLRVAVIAATTIVCDSFDTYITDDPVQSWPLTLPSLILIGVFAIILSFQRDEIGRRAQEADDAHAQVKVARNNLQRFLGMVAHDLRAPLVVLNGYAEILQDSSKSTSATSRRKAIEGIVRTTNRIDRLSGDLLDAARIGSGRFEIRASQIDLVGVIREIIESQQASTTEHRILLRAPPHLEGEWDHERIVQVFTNLISNAIKYSDDGEVRVTVQHGDGKAIVCVTDDGVGIAPDKLDHLFDPFTRLEPDPGRTGTGLGLYITKGIVEAHHGRIWVDSVPGKGSTFFVELPRASAQSGDGGRDGIFRHLRVPTRQS